MKDNGTDDDESAGLLPSRMSESYDVTLPKNIFINSSILFCYEICNYLAFRIWILSWLPFIIWWKLYTNLIAVIFTSLVHYSLNVAFGFLRDRTISKQITQFFKEIIKNTPCTDIENWELAAVSFNSFLYENKLWKTKHFFFDGSSCQVAFRRFLLPLSLVTSNETKLKLLKKFPYTEEALKVYFTEVDRKWNLINSQQLKAIMP
ncbi:AHL_G0013860.mRNA.1.CDS.1 [Saccharomyces cerevisiae]|nr:CPG_1a_G0013840.mRNA.1.CDS.1 [Saccharomyces cerevisiae]CAI4409904.1 AIE_G0013890.mRNA.1.CDS.1 [Saccharomyces cerevisiae]CAI4414335.1 AVB_G0013570.mRNA.1.CDS.1 [Saccharomyces cerevisiae]CAI4877719.1 AHL_G0013860.mRNA.1.CDS.1 [Saccharomyces cerevisiae]CAI6613812.1 AIE_G0013890.mRNA.1.CDS.1 [Saccharomyces cerevisiae]